MTWNRFSLVAVFALMATGSAPAQIGRPGRPAGWVPGLPNPMSDPAFNWWYRHAPTYWNGSFRQVIPYPGGNPYFAPGYGPAYPYAVPSPYPVPVSPVTGGPLTPSDIHVQVPVATARLFVAGVELPGGGLDRHLSLPPVVDTNVVRQVSLTCNWTDAAGRPHSAQRLVHLDGRRHGAADFR